MDTGTIYLIIVSVLIVISLFKDLHKTKKALIVSYKMALKVFPILLMVFILMGAIQAFVSKEFIATALGSGTGIFSILIGEGIGSVALVMPAAVFPFGGFLHDNGAGYGALIGFIMSSILIGISTLPLELQIFGKRFTVTRNVLTLVLIFLMGIIFKVIL